MSTYMMRKQRRRAAAEVEQAPKPAPVRKKIAKKKAAKKRSARR